MCDRYVCAHLHGVGGCGTVARLATADAHHAEGQRPRLLDVFRRDHEHLENEGWAPGTPLTNQLDVITEDQIQAYRDQLHREREQRGG